MRAARDRYADRYTIAFKIFAVLVAALAAALLPASASAAPDEREAARGTTTVEAPTAGAALAPGATDQVQGQIKSEHTDKCLAALPPPNTTTAFQFTCNFSYTDQLWTASTVGDGHQFKNAASGMCLAAHAYEGAVPFQFDCNTAYRDQQWFLRFDGSVRQLVNVNSGLCMAIREFGDGATPSMHSCGNVEDQDWHYPI